MLSSPSESSAKAATVQTYSVRQLNKSWVNSEKYCDCCFLVGSEQTKIYAFKAILGCSSPVFDSMLYGTLREDTSKPISIPDLTPLGFMNMVKYRHGYKIDELDLQIDERMIGFKDTYKAADKYMLTSPLIDDLCAYVTQRIDVSNCLIIYDQLIELRKEDMLDVVKKFVQWNCEAVFQKEYFVRISEDTLVDLLKGEYLKMREIDVLKSVLRWVNAKLQRIGFTNSATVAKNQRKLFLPFKSLIRFTDLTTDDVSQFDEMLKTLLTTQEFTSLLLNMINKAKPFTVGYQSPRVKRSLLSIGSECLTKYNLETTSISASITVNRQMSISSIDTTLPSTMVTGLQLKCVDEDGKSLELKIEKLAVDGKWSFKFDRLLEMEPETTCKFRFKFDRLQFMRCVCLNRTDTFKDPKSQTTFRFISAIKGYHCIRKIHFYD